MSVATTDDEALHGRNIGTAGLKAFDLGAERSNCCFEGEGTKWFEEFAGGAN